MKTLEDRIATLQLTKKERVLADYILAHQDGIGLTTARGLAQAVAMTDTTVIRFLRKLGFTGFVDFRQQMNARMVEQLKNPGDVNLSPGEKYAKTTPLLASKDMAAEVMGRTMENLQKTAAELDSAKLKAAAEVLRHARRKYIVGFRGSSSCAAYMFRKLVILLPNVVQCSYADSMVLEQLIDITKNDCVFMYSFPRHSEINHTIIEIAHKAGAKIILMTNKVTSPLASLADYVIPVQVEGVGYTNSYVVPLAVSEILLLMLGQQLTKKEKARMEDLEHYITEGKLY